MSNFNRAFIAAQHHYDNMEPDDEPDYLEDKPRGFCPWDGKSLIVGKTYENDDYESDHPFCDCNSWDYSMTESENRSRYAEERAKEAELARRLNKEGVDW